MRILKKRSDIEKTFKTGVFGCCGILCLKFRPNSQAQTRIAISVGLKLSKKATERNRAKRVIRESVRKYYENIKPGYDLVFYLKNAKSENINYHEICEAIRNVLKNNMLLV